MTDPSSSRSPIAVVGASALFPGSIDATGFWRDILTGRDLISDVPPSHWLVEDYYDPDPSAADKTYAKRGGFLGDVDFDAIGWGIPPQLVPETDTSQLLALIVAQKVLEDASGGQPDTLDRSRMSVILGCTSGQELMGSMVSRLQRPIWVKALRESGMPESQVQEVCARISSHYTPWRESTFPGLLGNVVAGRIANRLNLGGTNCVTDAACASTLSALAMGVHELQLGESDFVIAGGVDTMNDIFMYVCFSKTPALSPTGDCRPFSDRADGTMLGEGLGMLALKRLADAEAAGDRIHAVIHGVGSSSDGRAKSVYAPRPEGQASSLRRAYAQSGYGPDTVELIEAHGTGTKAGDAAEFAGLSAVFSETERKGAPWCALGSVKSQIGHAKSAAGAAGLFKAVMALRHRVLPPTIKVDKPNPALAIEASPFHLTTRARPWVRGSDHPRRASVSSFGFGGSNFHVALSEYRGAAPAARLRTLPVELLALGAQSPSALVGAMRALATEVKATRAPGALAWFAHRAALAFDGTKPARVAMVVKDVEGLFAELERAAAVIEAAPEQGFSTPSGTHYGTGPRAGDIALLFPGQGSQSIDMGSDLAQTFDRALEVWDAAADLDWAEGETLADVVFPITAYTKEAADAQAARLSATQWAQPALAATSLSMLALLEDLGVRGDHFAGHSFGEVIALHAAGSLSRNDALLVARGRGRLMAEAAKHPGAMIAVSDSYEQVGAWLAELQAKEPLARGVVIANDNGPRQVVLSGRTEGIEVTTRFLEGLGAAVRRLPVATAFHSEVVSEASEAFGVLLEDIAFAAPQRPVYATSSAAPYASDPKAMRACLAGQLALPVRFREVIERAYEGGARIFIEVGSGRVLTGLTESILAGREHRAIALDRKGKSGTASLFEAAAALCAAGVTLRLEALFQGYVAPRDPALTPKPKLSIPINGSNYGKPYPPPGGASALPPPNPERVAEAIPALREQTAPQALAAPEPSTSIASYPPAEEAFVSPTDRSLPPYSPSASVDPSEATLGISDDWARAYTEVQRQTAEVHASYVHAMATSHMAFLDTVERSFLALRGAPASASHSAADAPSRRELSPMRLSPAAQVEPSWAEPAPSFATDSEPAKSVVSEPHAPAAPMAKAPEMPRAPALVAAPKEVVEAAPSVDLYALLLQVVSDKTGYPADMLSAEMTLEGDLGIDSIKRVEILSGMQERAPGLPQVDTSVMAKLGTLGQIVDYMTERMAVSGGAPAAASKPASAASEAPAVDLYALLLQVVSDKTGYPAEMLSAEMTLEGDLGIDSIKRVEILSGMQERAPGLPQVDTSVMAKLGTLGQIVDYMSARIGGGTKAPSEAAPAAKQAEVTLPPEVTLPSEAKAPALGRFVMKREPRAALGMAPSGVFGGGLIAVTSEGSGVSEEVVRLLCARGANAEHVDEVPSSCFGVVFLGALRKVEGVDEAVATQLTAFSAAKAFAQGAPSAGLFVTVQDTGGSFGMSPFAPLAAWSAGVSGLCRTLGKEHPQVSVKAIDLDCGSATPTEQAERIVAEIMGGGPDRDVALSAEGGRFVMTNAASDIAHGELVLAGGDVVVVSGGARGVTAATVIALAAQKTLRFVLLGRTELSNEPEGLGACHTEGELKAALIDKAKRGGGAVTPKAVSSALREVLALREIRGTLRAIEDAGSEARYASVDIADSAAVARVLADIRAGWGPISAVIHGAGVIADKRIAEKTEDSYALVFRTKVAGLRALLDATSGDPLKALILFSSVAARTGNLGQSDYAMANEVLNLVAAAESQRRGDKTLVRSLGWGPWQSGMVTPDLRAHFERLDIPLIPLSVGAAMLIRELSHRGPSPSAVVLGGDPDRDLHPGAEPHELSCDLSVGHTSHPYLADHAVDGVVTVPVVMAIEWLSRVARAFAPGHVLTRLTDLRVLRGIVLRSFSTSAERLTLRCRKVSNGSGIVAQVELSSDRGVHYRVAAELSLPEGATLAASDAVTAATSKESLHLEGFGARPIYDGRVLFHGPRFQVITRLDGVSDLGASAELSGVCDAGWESPDGKGSFMTDPAAFDGALQVAVLWSQRMLGGASLPTSVSSVTLHSPPAKGPLSCILVGRQASGQRAVADIVLRGAEGQLVAELHGVETHQLPERTSVESRA